MHNNSGFGWDPQTSLPTAPEYEWDAVIVEHPPAREFRSRALIIFGEIDQIFSGTDVTGQYASHMRFSHNEDGNNDDEDNVSRSGNERNTEEAENDSESGGASEQSSNEATHTSIPRVRVLPRSLQGSRQREGNSSDGTPKCQRIRGEKMIEVILKLAGAHKTLNDASMASQDKATVIKPSKSNAAIKLIQDELAETIGISDRFRVVQLFANDQNAATIYCGMDDECRLYFVQAFLSGYTDFS
ncbi:hypothetical protein PI124_g9114 [Phytophthora idaei]|nr:hypothetical protein PI125_g15199 [Phytophthora idaei]KAG3151567.1 hypothetical protein PI126_g10941 [Phytophthora idaei]KAG3246151.1 hypothetical protein PI124_g9114 [Phytophthora idaei]